MKLFILFFLFIVQAQAQIFNPSASNSLINGLISGTTTLSGIMSGGTVSGTSMTVTSGNNGFILQDSINPTRKAVFNLANISAGTQRTFSFPDTIGTFGIISAAQTYSGLNTFSVSQTFSGNVVIASGTTVDFSNTAASSATSTYNGIWRFREGTWLPQVSGTTTSSAPTYTSQSGKWMITNDWVRISGALGWSAWTATGNMIIVNLPWTPNSSNANACSFRSDGLTLAASNYLQGLVVSGSPGRILLENYPVGGSSGTSVAVDTSVTALQFSCEYQTSL